MPDGGYERQRSYGPFVEVRESLPGFDCAVLQTYGGAFKAPTMWRGKVVIRFMGHDLMDIEGSLIDGKNGPFFAMPERNYQAQGGEVRYQKVMFIHDRNLLAALAECVRMELGDSSTEADDPPF